MLTLVLALVASCGLTLRAASDPGSLTSQTIGPANPVGSFVLAGGGINISVGGADIAGTIDQFGFSYETITGDFDVRVRVASLSLADGWSKAGLMARAVLATNSAMAAALTTPSGSGSYFVSRLTATAAAASAGNFPVNYPNTWLRLRRSGNDFTGYASFDGQNWSVLGTINNPGIPADAYVGLVACSHQNGQATTAEFRDYSTAAGGTVGTVRLSIEPPGPSRRTGPLAITEIMHSPAPPATNETEFVEIYNSNPFPEELSGYRLTGEINYTFAEGSSIAGNAYLIVAKDPAVFQSVYGISALGPFTNALASDGTLRLRNKEDAIMLEIPYSSHNPWPIGADQTGHSLVLTRASYGEEDPKAWSISAALGGSPGRHDSARVGGLHNVVINEFLAHTDVGVLDYVELYNHANQGVSIAGCRLSDSATTNKFVVPTGTFIPARGFIVFDQNQLGFGLSSAGETIYLRAPDNHLIDAVEFEAQANGVSSGRSPDGAQEIYPLAARTPGAANGAIRINDIVINELMYKPISGKSDDEYIELYNRGAAPVNIGAWRFTAGVNFSFPSNATIAAGAYVVVAKNTTNLLAKYPQLSLANTFGDFGGTLANGGERVALARPDLNVSTNNAGQVRTNTVYVVVDEVTYATGGNWAPWANEGGSSLELIDPRANHRLAHNWGDSDETAKAPWTTIELTGQPDNGAGSPPNILEGFLLGEGECLLDNVEVSSIAVSGGVNVCTNGTFESGLGGWLTRGDHIRTTVDGPGSGFGGGRALHVRADARGDSIMNRLRTPLSATLPTNSGSFATIRARVRWLKGWPEVVLRLHENYLECFGRMALPTNLGTPGAPNSRARSNNGPALYEVTHNPIVPDAGQSVAVTARVHDPDGVTSVSLKYRIDPSPSQNTVTMVDDGTGLDAVAGDGVFTGTIPGQGANTLVAFQVTAADSQGATRLFPVQDTSYTRPFECLVRFGDPVVATSFATYRQWMTQDNATDWQFRPSLSNERVFETFVYGNFRVIYNTSAKWSGSPYHQFAGSPMSTPAHYSIELPGDDIFLGTANLNKIHGPGNGAFDDNTTQREQFSYWIARQIGLPYNYRRFVNMFFNGNRRGGTVNIMEDTQTPGADVVNSIFPDDTEGDLYKIQPWFETGDTTNGAVSFDNRAWATLTRFLTVSNGAPVHKTARYRHNYLVRSPDTTANHYDPVYRLVDAANTPTNGWTGFNAAMESVAEMEQWMRIFAVHHSVGDWDHFGSQNAQNMYGYVGKNGKWKMMIWDMNIVLDNSGSWAAGANLFTINGADTIMPRVFNSPKFRRMYYRALKEICNGPWQTAKANDYVDAKYRALLAGGITPSAPTAITSFVARARSSILTTIAAEEGATFKVTSPTNVTASSNIVTISGEAPVEVAYLRVNGVIYPVTWVRVKNWEIRVALEQGTTLTIEPLTLKGEPIPGATFTVNITYPGSALPPEGQVVFNEIYYNPVAPKSAFIEIFNRSADHAFNLTGWRVNGVGYEFPDGSILAPNQHLVLAQDGGAFAGAFTNNTFFGQFDGSLDPDGETLSLTRPGATVDAPDLVVDRVRYEARLPWTAPPMGTSLELMDHAQDNSRSSAWAAQTGGGPQPIPTAWQQVVRTGNLLNGTNLFFWLTGASSAYIDDIVLVQNEPGSPNIVINGDFENGSTAPWILGTNYVNSVVVSDFSHSGERSLLVRGIGPATGSSLPATVQQFISLNPGYLTNAIYTLSYWIAIGTNPVSVGMRTLPGANMGSSGTTFVPVAPPIPTLASPGAPNNAVATNLPAFDAVWLNELQVNNVTGPLDNAGEREPWIELYNGGSTPVSLNGYYLANNYDTNLTQWPFPAGTSIDPGKFLTVWADGQPGQTVGANLHANFRLNNGTGSVALVRIANTQPQITDYLTYSGLGANLSYGDFPDGQPFFRTIMQSTTPGGTNVSRSINVFINEWMASNTNTVTDPVDGAYDDWFELYNAGDTAVDLGGYYLTDNLANGNQYRIPTNGQYTIPAGGFLLVWADNDPNQNDIYPSELHVSFQLARAGEAIGLFGPDGHTVIDSVTFGEQTNNISEGRFGDGATSRYFMTTPTPGGPNIVDGLGNAPPSLAPINNRTITLGQTVTFTAVGSDPDGPIESLAYSLDAGAPNGATIGLTSGQFSWTPLPVQAPSTNNITVRVKDSGVPSLTASRTVSIIVLLPPHITIGAAAGQVTLTFDTRPGHTYRVDYKMNLNDTEWLPLAPPAQAAGNSVLVQDTIGLNLQRFYRIVQTD
jgi:hypothetical protein